MQTYQFTDDCRIGIEEIDREHEHLFTLINQTMRLVKEGAGSYVAAKNLLAQLKDYAVTHFAHEEAYMEKIHDREIPVQRKEHDYFKAKIESYHIEGMTDEEGAKVMEELLSFTALWLYRHILGSDTMIGRYTSHLSKEDFDYTDAYRTGIEFIDEEHKVLFDIIRQTNDAVHEEFLHDKYDVIVNILTQLKQYTEQHFADEEAYMERIGYAALPVQKAAHISFVERLCEIDFDEVDENQQAHLEELIEFLLEWLINHIQKMDKKIPLVKDKL
jgi:hemerythrin